MFSLRCDRLRGVISCGVDTRQPNQFSMFLEAESIGPEAWAGRKRRQGQNTGETPALSGSTNHQLINPSIRVPSWFVVLLADVRPIPLEPCPSPWRPFVVLRAPSWLTLSLAPWMTLNGFQYGEGVHFAAKTCVLQSDGIGVAPVLGLSRSSVLTSSLDLTTRPLLPGRVCTLC